MDSDGITFMAKTMRKQFREEIPGNFVDNGWHTVFIQYRLGNLTMDVDGDITVLWYCVNIQLKINSMCLAFSKFYV